ncbi:MAG: hypothetical protein ACKOPN_05905, partial [Prochlorococcaceae cyanobacterium]
ALDHPRSLPLLPPLQASLRTAVGRQVWIKLVGYRLIVLFEGRDAAPEAFELPPRKSGDDDRRPPRNEQFFVPNAYP